MCKCVYMCVYIVLYFVAYMLKYLVVLGICCRGVIKVCKGSSINISMRVQFSDIVVANFIGILTHSLQLLDSRLFLVPYFKTL